MYRIVPATGWGCNLERWNGAQWVFLLTGSGWQVAHEKRMREGVA